MANVGESDRVKIARIQENQKTARVALIVGGAVVGVGLVVAGVVIATNDDAWWVSLLKILVPTLFAGGGTSYVFHKVVVKVRLYLRNHNQRTIMLERMLDPNRESSRVNPDGTSKND